MTMLEGFVEALLLAHDSGELDAEPSVLEPHVTMSRAPVMVLLAAIVAVPLMKIRPVSSGCRA